MEAVELEYRNRHARYKRDGGHWFDVDSMRFFQTRIGKQFWRRADDVWVFVTSEKPRAGNEPRLYSVRVLTVDGRILTLQPFWTWSRARATRVAEQLARFGRARVRKESPREYQYDDIYMLKDGCLEQHVNGWALTTALMDDNDAER